jgi:CBS-domain-containing membrane protein
LSTLHVEDAFDPDPQVIGEQASVSQLLEHLQPGTQTQFPVVDRDLRLVGMVGVAELGRLAQDQHELSDLLLAADVANPVSPLHPDSTLLAAIGRMGTSGVATLPVTDPESGRLLGILDRGHVLALYERAVAGQAEGSGERGA